MSENNKDVDIEHIDLKENSMLMALDYRYGVMHVFIVPNNDYTKLISTTIMDEESGEDVVNVLDKIFPNEDHSHIDDDDFDIIEYLSNKYKTINTKKYSSYFYG